MNDDPSQILQAQAYHRSERCLPLARRYEETRHKIPSRLTDRVDKLFQWFLLPTTLWPFNLHALLSLVLDRVVAKRRPDPSLELLLDFLPPPPHESAIPVVVAHEHDVQSGHYEHLIAASAAKFAATEKALARNRDFIKDWKMLSARFNPSDYEDHKGIIRRTLVPERNWRGNFGVDWNNARSRFQTIFDTFCAKWNLYGIRDGKPLLQKLSVNLTPFGTMIFIPAYWSFDPKRDIRWGAVTKLHKSRGQHRQGAALAESTAQRQRDAIKLACLDMEAKSARLRGTARHEFLCRGLGWDPRTDPKRIARLRKLP